MKKTAVVFFVLLSGLCAFLLWGPQVTETIPPNAQFFADKDNNCFPIPYVNHYNEFLKYGGRLPKFSKISLAEARQRGMKIIDRGVDNDVYTVGPSQNILLHFLSRCGLWPKWKARWNDDGSWNW